MSSRAAMSSRETFICSLEITYNAIRTPEFIWRLVTLQNTGYSLLPSLVVWISHIIWIIIHQNISYIILCAEKNSNTWEFSHDIILWPMGYFNAKISSMATNATFCSHSHQQLNLLFRHFILKSENTCRCFNVIHSMHVFTLMFFNINHQIKIRKSQGWSTSKRKKGQQIKQHEGIYKRKEVKLIIEWIHLGLVRVYIGFNRTNQTLAFLPHCPVTTTSVL